MRPDNQAEQTHVQDILGGITALEEQLGLVPEHGRSPLFPFKLACECYQRQTEGLAGLELTAGQPLVRECMMLVAAAMDLVRYYHATRRLSEFRNLTQHFSLVGDGLFGIAGTYGIQMSKGSPLRKYLEASGCKFPEDGVAKDATRKTIELMFGLAALNAFESVELENPKHSDSFEPNPDLIIGFEGKRYGLACKSVSSLHEASMKENVDKGVSQLVRTIRSKRVDERCGIVVIDVSAILDQDRLYMPGPGVFWGKMHAGQAMQAEMDAALAKIYAVNGPRQYHEIFAPSFKDSNLPVGVLFYAHGLMICDVAGAAAPVYQKALQLAYGGDTSSILPFLKRLDRAVSRAWLARASWRAPSPRYLAGHIQKRLLVDCSSTSPMPSFPKCPPSHWRAGNHAR